MLSFYEIPEAVHWLTTATGRVWTESELFDAVSKMHLTLRAAPPGDAQIEIGWRMAVLQPADVFQVWQTGQTKTLRSIGNGGPHGEIEEMEMEGTPAGEKKKRYLFTEPLTVTRDMVRVTPWALKRIAGEYMPIVAPTDTQTQPVTTVQGDFQAPSPLPVTTGDIAYAFAGLHGWNEKQWKKPLGDRPKWLANCVVTPGARGALETRWNPVLIAAALVQNGYAKPNSVRSKFQTMLQLRPWLDEWKTYEADNFKAE